MNPTAAGIIFRSQGAVLLLMRAATATDHPNTWGLPAGKIEAGETPEQAAIRETMEETGFTLQDLSGLTLVDSANGFNTYAVELPEPFTPTLNDEHTSAQWAPLGNLPAPLHPALVPTLAALPAMDSLSRRDYDGNGWFEVKANPISKVGVFQYSGKQLGRMDEPDRIFNVLRPAEELASAECLESFKLLPWTDDHTMIGPTAEAMSPNAVAAEVKGVHGVIGQEVFFEGDTLFGNIKAFSSTLAQLIAAGKRELSAGYRCTYDWVSGVFGGQHYDAVQRQIRGNHLALVEKGRMGPGVAVMDRLSFTFDAKEIIMSDPEKKPEGGEGGGGEMTVAQLAKVVGELAPQVAAMNTALAKLSAAGTGAAPVVDENKPAPAAAVPGAQEPVADKAIPAAAMDAAIQAAIKTLKVPTFKDVLSEINSRDALVKKVTPFVGTFDHAEKTTAEVAVYACDKLGLKPAAGAEVATLDGFLHNRSSHVPAAHAEAMDSAVPGASFLDSQL